MADYYTHLSFMVPAVRVAEATWLTTIFSGLASNSSTGDDTEGLFPGMEISDEFRNDLRAAGAYEYWGFAGSFAPSDGYWIRSDDAPNLDALGVVLSQFLERYRPEEAITFCWAETCSSPRLDAFGGGVAIITAKDTLWKNLTNLEEAAKHNWEQHKILSFHLEGEHE